MARVLGMAVPYALVRPFSEQWLCAAHHELGVTTPTLYAHVNGDGSPKAAAEAVLHRSVAARGQTVPAPG
jgi:hypothetical protein